MSQVALQEAPPEFGLAMACIEIEAVGIGGDTCPISANMDWTIYQVKEALLSAMGIEIPEQVLFLGMSVMDNPTETLGIFFDRVGYQVSGSIVELSLVRIQDFLVSMRCRPIRRRGDKRIELESGTMTVAEATDQCRKLPHCKGFFCSASQTAGPVDVTFIGKFPYVHDLVQNEEAEGQGVLVWRVETEADHHPLAQVICTSRGQLLNQPDCQWLSTHRSIMLTAIKGFPTLLRLACPRLQADPELAFAAVSRDRSTVEFVAKELLDCQQFVERLIRLNANMLEHASARLRNVLEVVLLAVQSDFRALRYASYDLKENQSIVRAAVELRGDAFAYASDTLKSDGGFVRELVEQVTCRALLHASDQLRSDTRFVLSLVRVNDSVLQYASEVLRADRGFILEVVRVQGDAIRHASGEIKEDPNIMLAAIEQNPRAVRHAGSKLWSRHDFVVAVVQKHWNEVRQWIPSVPEAIRRDREFARVAIEQSPEALKYLADPLRQDPEIIYMAYKKDEQVATKYGAPSVFADRDFILASVGKRIPPHWTLVA